MPLIILSRRNITYRETGRGELTVMLIPGRDQIQIVKDLAGLGTGVPAKEAGTKTGTKKLTQLSRVFIGRRFIYGTLPTEISDLRQPVKVWLAEDFAPMQSQAFFYIISNTVVIHGVREQDDEGFQSWRTAQLPIDAADPLKSMINAISDYALAGSVDGLTVAVLNKLDLYEKLQQGLATYNISPIPFSKLKPQPNVKPLYRHRDFTVLYLTLAFFGFIGLIVSASYGIITYMGLQALVKEASDIQEKIDAIKLNQNVGQINDPQEVLKAMSRSINQQPSAIIDAAGMAASQLGDLTAIHTTFVGENRDVGTPSIMPGQVVVTASIGHLKEELLLMQEKQARETLVGRPWVREIRRAGSVGPQGDVLLTLQVDQAPGSPPPPEQPVTPPAESSPTAPVSGTGVTSATTSASATVAVSGSASISVSASVPAASGTQPVSGGNQ